VIERENEVARELLKQGKKKQAMLALKKRKYQEQLLEKSEQQLANIQDMVDSIEFSQMEKRVFDGLKAGNEVLKEIHSEMSIDAVEDLMADTQDALDYQNEIDKLLAGKLSDQDEEDILAELDALEKAAPVEVVAGGREKPVGVNEVDILIEEAEVIKPVAHKIGETKSNNKGERELIAAT